MPLPTQNVGLRSSRPWGGFRCYHKALSTGETEAAMQFITLPMQSRISVKEK